MLCRQAGQERSTDRLAAGCAANRTCGARIQSLSGVPCQPQWHADKNLAGQILCRKQGDPGKVLAVDKHGITVACGNDALRLEVLQRPGGKAQSAAQLLQAMPIKAGDHFSANYNQPPGCRSLTT